MSRFRRTSTQLLDAIGILWSVLSICAVPAGPLQAQSCCPLPDSIISTFAGTGTVGFSGDGGPALDAQIGEARGIAFDKTGNLYIAEEVNHRIRKVDLAGIITTFAGDGTQGSLGDGGPATSASLDAPTHMAFDQAGNLYINDWDGNVIRKVDTTGIITTVAGMGSAAYSGDGGLATNATLNFPYGVSCNDAGELYITDLQNHRIRKVDAGGTITTVCGDGTLGSTGDGGPASAAKVMYPESGVFDPNGDFVFHDDHVPGGNIRKIDKMGVITTVVVVDDDTEGIAFCGDKMYFSSWDDDYVHSLDLCGVIATVSGNGTFTHSGDGGPAKSAGVKMPIGLAVDAQHNLYVAEVIGGTIRKIALDCAPTATPACTWPATSTPTPSSTPIPSDTSTQTAIYTSTPTPSITPIPSNTSTPTVTATNTMTPTPTVTPLGPLRLWPNPFNLSEAARGTLKCADMPQGSTLGIFTVSGEKVFEAVEKGYRVDWDGRTSKGHATKPGVYYYCVRRGNEDLLKGILLIKDR